jgi:hypothetical protein
MSEPVPLEQAREEGLVRGQALGQIALVDLLDRLLGAGVVLAGDVVISLSGVDLVQIRLHALITSVRAEMAATTLLGKEGGPDGE